MQLVLGGEPSAVEYDALDIMAKLSKSLILPSPISNGYHVT